MSKSARSLPGRCSFSGSMFLYKQFSLASIFLENFEIFSPKSLNIMWKIFYQRTSFYDLYILLESSKNDLGRVKLGINGNLFGDESRVG